jgi:hypothetical protein
MVEVRAGFVMEQEGRKPKAVAPTDTSSVSR